MSDLATDTTLHPTPRHLFWQPVLARLPEPAAMRSLAKRSLDVAVALVLLPILAPILLVAAVAVRLSSPGAPAIFASRRIGYRGRVFRMFKIRTMVPDAANMEEQLARGDSVFFKLENDPRITPLGRVLRKFSLDELPQLWNVLRGDMSLVGPRPILLSDFDRMPVHKQLERFAVRPGITGLWQTSGRSRLSDRRRMELDLEYVRHWSFTADLRILFQTIPAVIRAEGAT